MSKRVQFEDLKKPELTQSPKNSEYKTQKSLTKVFQSSHFRTHLETQSTKRTRHSILQSKYHFSFTIQLSSRYNSNHEIERMISDIFAPSSIHFDNLDHSLIDEIRSSTEGGKKNHWQLVSQILQKYPKNQSVVKAYNQLKQDLENKKVVGEPKPIVKKQKYKVTLEDFRSNCDDANNKDWFKNIESNVQDLEVMKGELKSIQTSEAKQQGWLRWFCSKNNLRLQESSEMNRRELFTKPQQEEKKLEEKKKQLSKNILYILSHYQNQKGLSRKSISTIYNDDESSQVNKRYTKGSFIRVKSKQSNSTMDSNKFTTFDSESKRSFKPNGSQKFKGSPIISSFRRLKFKQKQYEDAIKNTAGKDGLERSDKDSKSLETLIQKSSQLVTIFDNQFYANHATLEKPSMNIKQNDNSSKSSLSKYSAPSKNCRYSRISAMVNSSLNRLSSPYTYKRRLRKNTRNCQSMLKGDGSRNLGRSLMQWQSKEDIQLEPYQDFEEEEKFVKIRRLVSNSMEKKTFLLAEE